ncbi:MAG: ATP synthase F1 subunit gamma [Chloroflexi bacterium]|nr:ATP synthase F1 subunit gamma [Chloroflexota bacterium]
MATPREIKRRISSVKNISKVTGALEAVSAAKVRKAQSAVLATRAYSNAALEILRDIAAASDGSLSHPLLDPRPAVNQVELILITSDRGLAGAYNSNAVRVAIEFELKQQVPIRYVTVGRKGRDIMLRRGKNVIAEFSNLPPDPLIRDITAITRTAIDDFVNGVVDEVYIIYTEFINTLFQEPRLMRLLPLQPEIDQSSNNGPNRLYTFEPDPDTVLEEILPRFTELELYQTVLESLASEHSARMIAMRNATESANALQDDLRLSYNKARQQAITNEMLDIVGGAESLAESSS